jgi:hypothetical protein
MKRLAAIGMIPLFAGFLTAQVQSRVDERNTTWDGTLVDATCQSTHTVHRETSTTTNPDNNSVTTRTETTRTDTGCPATATTTTFGILTRDGRFIRFDEQSNARVMQMMRNNPTWDRELNNSSPIHVRVMGTPSGDVAIVNSMAPMGYGTPQTGEAYRTAPAPAGNQFAPEGDQIYDARWHDDHGRLIVGANTITFEDLSNQKHSRTWNYAQIRELKRDSGKEVKIKPYSGDEYELHLEGSSNMVDSVYNMIGNRITAARGH